MTTFYGYECSEIDTGEPSTFSLPSPEALDANVQRGARVEQAAAAAGA